MKNLSPYAVLVALMLFAVHPAHAHSKHAKKSSGAAKTEKYAYKEVSSEKEVSDAVATGKVVVIKFYANWCSFCEKMKPEFEKAAEMMKNDAIFLSANTDKLPELARTFKVTGLPTTVIIRSKTGFMTAAELEKEVSQANGKAYGAKVTGVVAPMEAPAAGKASAKKMVKKS